jgi:hypothetical protein
VGCHRIDVGHRIGSIGVGASNGRHEAQRADAVARGVVSRSKDDVAAWGAGEQESHRGRDVDRDSRSLKLFTHVRPIVVATAPQGERLDLYAFVDDPPETGICRCPGSPPR